MFDVKQQMGPLQGCEHRAQVHLAGLPENGRNISKQMFLDFNLYIGVKVSG